MREDTPGERLVALRALYPAGQTEVIAEVVNAVLATMRGDLSAPEAGLLAEIEDLSRTIAAAKAELAELRVEDINDRHIPSATDELDAIVTHTASATDTILEACETLDRVAGEIGEASALKLQEATTRIYEACGFQDITGQRITKVVATLKTIEARIAGIMATFSGRPQCDLPVAPAEAELLNGPRLPALAMDQTDIDKLLASFD